MFLPLLCLATILAPTFPASCQPTCALPPSSGSIWVALFHPFSRSTTAPMRSCAAALRLVRPRMPHLAAHVAMADRRVRTKAVLPQPIGSRFQTRWFLHLLLRRRHETVLETFSYPARRFLHTRKRRRITGATDTVPVLSTGIATEVGPLTSAPPSRGQSSGGALWTPAYTPSDGQASWVYSSNPVLHLYLSCYVTVNKPVLSYLLLRLLPHAYV
jgi:hypothetical protein